MKEHKMTIQKVRARCFILYDGYAETSTNAGIMIQHARGFDTVEEALINLHKLSSAWIEDDYAYHVAARINVSTKPTVEDFWQKAIREDLQGWPNIWDAIVENGSWTTWLDGFEFDDRIVIADAPEVIADIRGWATLDKESRDAVVSFMDFGNFKNQTRLNHIKKHVFATR